MAWFAKEKKVLEGTKEGREDPVQIRVRGLRKSYGEHEVLQGIDLDIWRGEINIIIGGSGAGKSVFTRQLLRLETPDSGEILVDGSTPCRSTTGSSSRRAASSAWSSSSGRSSTR